MTSSVKLTGHVMENWNCHALHRWAWTAGYEIDRWASSRRSCQADIINYKIARGILHCFMNLAFCSNTLYKPGKSMQYEQKCVGCVLVLAFKESV